jgi:hypothetical protein
VQDRLEAGLAFSQGALACAGILAPGYKQLQGKIINNDLRALQNCYSSKKSYPVKGLCHKALRQFTTYCRSIPSIRRNTKSIFSIECECSAFVTFEVGRASARILDRLPRIRDPCRIHAEGPSAQPPHREH